MSYWQEMDLLSKVAEVDRFFQDRIAKDWESGDGHI